MSLLEIKALGKHFGGVTALHELEFTLEAGQMLALIGPNGAGKSTCFNLIGGQLQPDRGNIFLNGKNINGIDACAAWQLGIGRTFQIPQVFRSLTVRENLQAGLIARHGAALKGWQGSVSGHVAEVDHLLERVGIYDYGKYPAAELAYGDVKRLELALALISPVNYALPRLLLMDEPTAGMAAGERQSLMRLTAQLAREHNIGVLFTEHSMDVVFGFADEIMVLSRGQLIARGSPQAIRNNTQVQAVYLGENAGTVITAPSAVSA